MHPSKRESENRKARWATLAGLTTLRNDEARSYAPLASATHGKHPRFRSGLHNSLRAKRTGSTNRRVSVRVNPGQT